MRAFGRSAAGAAIPEPGSGDGGVNAGMTYEPSRSVADRGEVPEKTWGEEN